MASKRKEREMKDWKANVITVTEGDDGEPVKMVRCYGRKIGQNEVRQFVLEWADNFCHRVLDKKGEIEKIVSAILRNRGYSWWYEERFCFQIIEGERFL